MVASILRSGLVLPMIYNRRNGKVRKPRDCLNRDGSLGKFLVETTVVAQYVVELDVNTHYAKEKESNALPRKLGQVSIPIRV